MAKSKNKPEDEDLDDVEMDLAEDADDIDEEDGDSEEESGEEKESEEPEGGEKEESEEDSDESSEEVSKKKEAEAELEEKRVRRRREKQLRKQRQQRERLEQQNLIIMMAEEIKRLKEGHTETQKNQRDVVASQIEEKMQTVKSIYNRSFETLKKAIAEGDADAFVAATQQKDQAERAYRSLHEQKQKLLVQREEKEDLRQAKEEKETKEPDSSGAPALDNQGKRYLKNFISKNSWFKPNNPDLDTKTALTIDADLYEEGYDPNSQEYWDELQDRVKERMPHVFKKTASKPRNIVGGNNKSSIGGRSPDSVPLPKEFVQALKDANMWDDEKKRKEAIKQYHSNKKGS